MRDSLPDPATPPRPGRGQQRRTLLADGRAVSEVIGFLLTFAIIAGILVVGMLSFNDAQSRAERRIVEIQTESIAQRVAGAIVDAALFLERQGCAAGNNPATVSLRLELPPDLQGEGYRVELLDGPARVLVTTARATAQQTVFGAVNDDLTCAPDDPRPGLCTQAAGGRHPFAASGNLYVVHVPSAPACLGVANSPVS